MSLVIFKLMDDVPFGLHHYHIREHLLQLFLGVFLLLPVWVIAFVELMVLLDSNGGVERLDCLDRLVGSPLTLSLHHQRVVVELKVKV